MCEKYNLLKSEVRYPELVAPTNGFLNHFPPNENPAWSPSVAVRRKDKIKQAIILQE